MTKKRDIFEDMLSNNKIKKSLKIMPVAYSKTDIIYLFFQSHAYHQRNKIFGLLFGKSRIRVKYHFKKKPKNGKESYWTLRGKK